jgi:hypothetical protein
MQDAVGLIGKQIQIKEINYRIKEFYFVPGTNYLYVGLKSDYVTVNWKYEDLLPYLIEQIKL